MLGSLCSVLSPKNWSASLPNKGNSLSTSLNDLRWGQILPNLDWGRRRIVEFHWWQRWRRLKYAASGARHWTCFPARLRSHHRGYAISQRGPESLEVKIEKMGIICCENQAILSVSTCSVLLVIAWWQTWTCSTGATICRYNATYRRKL